VPDTFLAPAPRVDPVDTTGAGDAFNGALAVALAEGRDLRGRRGVRGRGGGALDARRGRPRGHAAPRRGRRLNARKVSGTFLAVAAAAYAGWVEPRRLVVRRMRSSCRAGRPRSPGCASACCTDLHAGRPHAGEDAVARWVARMNAEAPDLVLLGGDFTDAHWLFGGRLAPSGSPSALAGSRPRSAASPCSATTTGAVRDAHVDARSRRPASRCSRTTPSRSTRRRRFHVAGLADVRHRRPDVARALAGVPDGEPVIALAHDPDVFPYVPRASR
jgi:predicted MPP superfamily phosphohydrolase